MRLRCARCNTERLDTELSTFYLCNECVSRLTQQALHGTDPVLRTFEIPSYCGLCNKQESLSLTQWFLCPYCARLVNSYRLGRVSQAFASSEWVSTVQPHVPKILLDPVDVIELRPYQRAGRRRALATELDFIGREDGAALFWVELKTGQRSIADLATFQLDQSDCDDILNVIRQTGLPAYVFHVHLGKEYHPPSNRILTHGVWWTDVYAMTEAFLQMERRQRNGGKLAAHFSRECFQPLASLGPALSESHHLAILARLQKQGPPEMYRLEPRASS